uniref:Mucin 2, oligomeric mucus/gel-forming n=1 Tax=Chelonoidis abingdonii TaxID=106734 RepID=A0A8C0JEV0_CHEAB
MGLRLASFFALWLALSCANEIKKGRTQNHGHYVCSTWGNNHFKSFDGDFYQFPGLCDYNFASDCRESYQEFSVHIQRAMNENGHPDIQYVLITIKDVVIYLTQNAVVVDDVTTPYYSSGLLIENSEIYTKVYARAGLVLMWNRENSLMLELDSKFNNNTCGLCGDYNGQQVYNEFISNDMIFNPITFGNMQKINKPNTICEDPDETQIVATCNQHRDECLSLLTSSVFADCESRLNLEMYVQACMQDKCACQGAEDSFCLCNTISEYSRQCSHAGGRPGNWRTEKFCPKTCPGNMIYQESSSPCISTCSHLEISSLCEEHFMDGCFCPEGTVYDDVSGKGCVSVNQCHCKLHGSLYSPGQNITNECEECTCDSGRWVCKQLSCPGSCLVEGGAHITTFDGKKYTFHGDCYYVLSKGGINDTHALLAELSPCGSTDKQTCLKTVVLLIDHKKNILVFRSDGTVLLNELEVHLPHVTASFSIFQPTSYHIIVRTYFGLKLQIQLVPIMQLFVVVDQSAQGKLQGLCGNFNGIEYDDFKTAGGLVEATGSAFANTWKAQATCKDQVDNLEDPCALSFESENYAEYWCSLLKNLESPFARCHSAIDPVEYYKRCKYDTCNCKNSEECLCGALSSYARACAFKGIMLGGWRQTVCNKEVSSCSASQVFRYNLTTCQHTCRSLADGEKHCLEGFIPIDGCGCPDNTYMNEKGNCVSISRCTCYYKGSYLEPGDVIVKQEEQCPSPKIHFDCSSVKSWSSQTPLQLSCHTLDTDYFQTECVSGCMCPHGLIDDGRGGCVKEKDCPCIHNKQFYASGQTIKVGCNKCTCRKGRWTCTDNVCYGTCTVYGSGHYISFDGKHYDFDGHCEYVAAQDYCGKDRSGSFSIVTVNVPCGTTGVTCSKAIKIFLGRTELKFEDKQNVEIQRGVGDHIQYRNRTVGLYLVIEASNGVMLIWDKKTTIFIKLTPNYKGKICGLCGNFDDKSNNDFTTRNGLLVTNPLEFGNSWKLSGSCPDVMDEILPCNLKPHRKSWAEKECSIIRSEVFKVCRDKVDPTPFYENCVHDACSCDSGGDCECFCSAVAAYAQECIKAEACVFWRTPDICPIFCDYYNPRNECEWHYEPCGRHIVTCRIINNVSTNFSVPYLEGCYPRCPKEKPIFDEDLKECVTEVECGCYVNGTRYENGSEIPPKDDFPGGMIPMLMCLNYEISVALIICFGPMYIQCFTLSTAYTATMSCIFPFFLNYVFHCCFAAPCTPLSQYCWWSDWINVNKPKYGPENGDYETYDKIREWNASVICETPLNISCRAQQFPDTPIEDLGQKVTCDVSTGLICNNRDQDLGSLIPICYDYEISVYCCSSFCTTTATTTTTTGTTTSTSTETTTPTTTTTTTETTTTETTTPTTTTTETTTTETTTPPTTTTTTETTTTETTTPTTTTTTTETTTTETTTPTTTTTTTETTTTETTTPTTTTTTTETTTTETTTPTTTTTTTETTTTETTTPTTTTTTTETTTTETTTPTTTTTTTETTTTETTTPTTTTTTTETTTTETTTPTTTTTTTETTTTETTTPTTTTTTTETTTTETTTPPTTTTTTETTTTETTTPTTTTTTTETTTTETTTPTTTTTTTETTTTETTTPTTTTTTTETTTTETTTPTTTTTTTETTTTETTTPTTTTTTTETTTTETTTPTTTTTTTETTTTETTTPTTTTTTTETTTTETTTPTTTTTTTETTTTETTTPTTTTTETTTTETTTPTTTTTTTETTTTETTTPTTTTTTTETTTTETTTPTTTTTTTETTTTETTTPTTTTTTTETTTTETTTPTTTTTTTETTTTETTTTTTTTTETTTTETTTPTTTTTETTTTETTTPTTTTTTTETTTTETTTPTTTTIPPPGCLLPNGTIINVSIFHVFIIRESYWPCNCTELICINNNTWTLVSTVCELPPKPTCVNGLTPVLVQGECCPHWECDCYCTGWGDPHYVTFDGLYYSYQGNCTYVLVEEINKKIDDFGIYIDNYHCIAQDRVSCPRTLIVRYETQEVRIKTIRMIPLKVQVTVNNQEVATPFEKYGVKVFKSGINHVVEISRIGVNVTYNGLAFSIRLSYQRFGNNTQGQCGTCTNNTADDCMLPGGKIIGNCETMADHWVINDPEKPDCYPSPPSTEAPPVTPPPCKPSDLCKLIKEGPFKACHPFVNPDHYYAACVFDSCALPNSKLECASLQNYAALCADQGVCVDWRGHTRDICPLTCPSNKVYKACGPIEEVTCKSSQIAQNQNRHVEGCFCPAGTMLYGDGVDVCVKTCGCVGPDNKPRKFGEIFEFDCQTCICLEGGSGISCVPRKCPEQEDKPSCSDEGFYEVTEVNPDNICCNITSCRCNTSFCTTKPPKCKIGYEPVSDIATGKCCPTYKCVFADKCHDCVCTEKSNSSGLNVISCKHIPCNEACQPGYELKDVKGECCPKCVQTKCVVNKGDSTVLILSPDETENDPKDNCTLYSCVSIKGQLISSTSKITCPSFNEENCQAVSKFGTFTLILYDNAFYPSPCSVTQIVDYITHKGCRSVDKVYLTQCEGSCGTFSLYSAEANSMEHKCSCCREAATSEKQVLLQCPNGKSVVHKYLHVDRCECLNTECTEPSSSEESKESEEQSSIERVKRAIWKILK